MELGFKKYSPAVYALFFRYNTGGIFYFINTIGVNLAVAQVVSITINIVSIAKFTVFPSSIHTSPIQIRGQDK